jgi:uncharacterized membrane protein YgdD (TMEM256/DUF423 family)
MTVPLRLLIFVAGLMGSAGVVLAAMAAHGDNATRLLPASSMLLFHAPAVIGAVLLIDRALVAPRVALVAACGLAAGAVLFAGTLTLHQFAGRPLFPMSAPTGGTLMILSWLLFAVAAVLPRRG